MPAKAVIATLYLFIAAMLLQLLAPTSAHAVNWNSQETPPIVTTDAATAEFWNACSTLAGTSPDDDEPGYVSWFDWYSIETPDNLNLVPFCVTAYVGPEPAYNGPDTPAAPILALHIRFYKGTPGHIDAAYILAQIHATHAQE